MAISDEFGQGYGDRLLSLVMLQVLDDECPCGSGKKFKKRHGAAL